MYIRYKKKENFIYGKKIKKNRKRKIKLIEKLFFFPKNIEIEFNFHEKFNKNLCIVYLQHYLCCIYLT